MAKIVCDFKSYSQFCDFVIGKNFHVPLTLTLNAPHINPRNTEKDALSALCSNINNKPLATILAGEPKRPDSSSLTIRKEILEKWNQRPKFDIYKEWGKKGLHL